MWVIILDPALGAGGALEKGHPLLYLDVPSAPKVPNVCLRETVCGTAQSEKEGSSRSLGVDLSTNRTHSCLSCPDCLHSPSFRRFAATLCRPVPLSGKLSFPTLPVSVLENPQENLFTLGVSAQPRTRAQGRADSRCSLPATRGVGLCGSLFGWLGPGAQMWSLGATEGNLVLRRGVCAESTLQAGEEELALSGTETLFWSCTWSCERNLQTPSTAKGAAWNHLKRRMPPGTPRASKSQF